MNKSLALFLFAALCFANPTTALACSPPDDLTSSLGGTVSSWVPAKAVPEGAAQMRVAPQDVDKMGDAINDIGKITLQVKQVVDGSFSGSTVLLNTSNLGCSDEFGRRSGDFFITVLPMEYPDGVPVSDQGGASEFASLLYKHDLYSVSEDKMVPQFAEYSRANYSFGNYRKLQCLLKESIDSTKWSADVWRRCVRPGEYISLDCEMGKDSKLICAQDDLGSTRPPELRRGYSFWGHHYRTILAALLILFTILGIGYLSLKKKLRRT